MFCVLFRTEHYFINVYLVSFLPFSFACSTVLSWHTYFIFFANPIFLPLVFFFFIPHFLFCLSFLPLCHPHPLATPSNLSSHFTFSLKNAFFFRFLFFLFFIIYFIPHFSNESFRRIHLNHVQQSLGICNNESSGCLITAIDYFGTGKERKKYSREIFFFFFHFFKLQLRLIGIGMRRNIRGKREEKFYSDDAKVCGDSI